MATVFYIAAAVAVVSTAMVITRLNAVHALLYLILSLLSTAVMFWVLGAPFVAALEVIIYAGAIMVVFVFVIMMLNLGEETVRQERALLKPGMFVLPAILAAILGAELLYILYYGGRADTGQGVVGPKQVGVSLFTTYLFAVELAAMLLLAGLVGAFHVGRRETERELTDIEGTSEVRRAQPEMGRK